MPNKPTKSAMPIKLAKTNKSFKYGRKRSIVYSTLKKNARMLNGKETKQTYTFKNNAHISNDGIKEPHSSQRELPKQSDQIASVQKIQVPSDQDPNEPIVTYSSSKMQIEKDPIIKIEKDNGALKKKNKKTSDQDFENHLTYNPYTKYDRMRWYEFTKSYPDTEFLRSTEAHNKHNDGAPKKDVHSNCEDSEAKSKNGSEKNFTQEWLHQNGFNGSYLIHKRKYNRVYEEEMKIKSEITYNALMMRIDKELYEEMRNPYNLYKLLDKKFKKAYIQDFFKDLISNIVEVLEHMIYWIAKTFSLPLPEPVDHDKLIYFKVEGLNYSLFITERIRRLMSRGNATNESIGFMYWDQW